MDWGFKSGLRDTGSSLKGLNTAAESESRYETCNRSKYSMVQNVIGLKRDIGETCLRYVLSEARWGSGSTGGSKVIRSRKLDVV